MPPVQDYKYFYVHSSIFSCKSQSSTVALPRGVGYTADHMKKDLHPEDYRLVIFDDSTSGKRFLIGSTIRTNKTDKWDDGKEYPVYQVEISSASHPFYTGQTKVIDTAGRVEKFRNRAAASKK